MTAFEIAIIGTSCLIISLVVTVYQRIMWTYNNTNDRINRQCENLIIINQEHTQALARITHELEGRRVTQHGTFADNRRGWNGFGIDPAHQARMATRQEARMHPQLTEDEMASMMRLGRLNLDETPETNEDQQETFEL